MKIKVTSGWHSLKVIGLPRPATGKYLLKGFAQQKQEEYTKRNCGN